MSEKMPKEASTNNALKIGTICNVQKNAFMRTKSLK